MLFLEQFKDPGIMERAPRDPREGILPAAQIGRVLLVGLLLIMAVFLVFETAPISIRTWIFWQAHWWSFWWLKQKKKSGGAGKLAGGLFFNPHPC